MRPPDPARAQPGPRLRRGLAWVIIGPGCKQYAAAAVPSPIKRWARRRKTQAGTPRRLRGFGHAVRRAWQVATWELVAAVCALHHLLSPLRDAEIVMFVDSKAQPRAVRRDMCALPRQPRQAALGVLLRGTSRQPDYNALVADIWFAAAAARCLLSAWYVPSALNVADAPTRPATKAAEIAAMDREGFTEVAWPWPRAAPWGSC